MPIIATGQISIVDLSDGKSLSCYITSNLPKTQILDPNPGGAVNPDWSGTPKLTLTPVVFANQTALALNATGLSNLRIVTDPEYDDNGSVVCADNTDNVMSIYNDLPKFELLEAGVHV